MVGIITSSIHQVIIAAGWEPTAKHVRWYAWLTDIAEPSYKNSTLSGRTKKEKIEINHMSSYKQNLNLKYKEIDLLCLTLYFIFVYWTWPIVLWIKRIAYYFITQIEICGHLHRKKRSFSINFMVFIFNSFWE